MLNVKKLLQEASSLFPPGMCQRHNLTLNEEDELELNLMLEYRHFAFVLIDADLDKDTLDIRDFLVTRMAGVEHIYCIGVALDGLTGTFVQVESVVAAHLG
jgi:hypothetical protein